MTKPLRRKTAKARKPASPAKPAKKAAKKPAKKRPAGKTAKKAPKKPARARREDLSHLTEEERVARRRKQKQAWDTRLIKAGQEIRGEEWLNLLAGIDWDRRLACRRDLGLFCREYLPNLFYLSWSLDQRRCIKKAETVMLDDGAFALAMPRAGGKTAMVRGAITWATAYGHKRFPYNIGSNDSKSLQTLKAIKTFLYSSPKLLQDFPEITWGVRQTNNSFHGTKGQVFNGCNTHIEWGANSIRFPCFLLPEEDAAVYLAHDPESVHPLPDRPELWIPRQAGVNIGTAGIGGSIRGEAETHPVLLEQPRPDVVILDDIQKDQAAESPAQVEKLILLIDGAIAGLAGPGGHIAGLMPCTVTKKGDVSDTYLSQEKKPEWRGERCKLVSHWPDGITDTQISLESEAGLLWTEYLEMKRESYRLFEAHSRDCEHCRENLADPCRQGKRIQYAPTKFYEDRRFSMDEGFEVTWEERYGNPAAPT